MTSLAKTADPRGSHIDMPPIDRRVIRTRRMIRDALTELVDEKGLSMISVSDITSRADINRGTFYAHYRDLDDLLECSESEVLSGIMEIQEGVLARTTLPEVFDCYEHGRPLPYAVALYDYLRANGPFLRAIMGPHGDPGFTSKLSSLVMANLFGGVLNEKYRDSSIPLFRYYIAYYASAQIGVISSWLESGMRETSEEMALIALSIMFMNVGDAIVMHGVPDEGGEWADHE